MPASPLVPALAEASLSRLRALAYVLVLPALALVTPRLGLTRGALALVWLSLLTCALSALVPFLRTLSGRNLPRATGYAAPFIDLAALTGLHLLAARAFPQAEPLVLLSLVATSALTVVSAGLRLSPPLVLLTSLAAGAALFAYVRLHPGPHRLLCLAALGLAGVLGLLVSRVLGRAAQQVGLRRFLPPAVAQRLGRSPEGLAAAGARRDVTVLYTELRGVSAYASEREPEEALRLLRTLRGLQVMAVHEEGGTLLAATGDGVLAVFGAPEPRAGDARAALHAATALVRHVRALALSEDVPVAVGVGLHRGRVVAGDVGDGGVLEYALGGDVATIARRLQSLTHEMKADVILSADVSAALDAPVPLRALGPMRIQGRSRSVEAYAWEEAPSDPAASLLHVPR